MARSEFVPPFRVTPAERLLLAKLAPARGDASRLLRRLIAEEAARKGITPEAAPAPKRAA